MKISAKFASGALLLASVTLAGCVTIKGSSATPEEARAEYLRTSTQIALAQGVADRCSEYRFNSEASEMLYGLASDLADREYVGADRRAELRLQAKATASDAIALQQGLGETELCNQIPVWMSDGSIDPTLLITL
ncbi:hypothetical protein [Shimia ponticola]|uniref:hypothetical protein n=1 Tax=Shimia ponticola TaxID=2582893 RepID=UPI0011BDF806|nr:hypothetical protein [Shimia ponticola]